jgi:transposase
LPVVVVNPAQVRALALTLSKRAKTDPIDAPQYPRGCSPGSPRRPSSRSGLWPMSRPRALADLLARRRQILQMPHHQADRAEGQREKRASKRMRKSIQRLKTALQKELTDIDREIPHGFGETVRGSPLWRHTEDLMASVPGVGPMIARPLIPSAPIIGLPDIGTLDRRQVAALAGWPRSPASRAPDGQGGAARPSSPPAEPLSAARSSWRHGRHETHPDPQSLPRASHRSREGDVPPRGVAAGGHRWWPPPATPRPGT